jgi:hypothetical protein
MIEFNSLRDQLESNWPIAMPIQPNNNKERPHNEFI